MKRNSSLSIILGLTAAIAGAGIFALSSTALGNYKRKKMKTKEIYFAGGCFWGTEHFMKQIRGVVDTETGYANGTTATPTYEEVCTGRTGHAETVRVEYDPKIVSLQTLLDLYFETIDPTSLNRQGNDRGTQYRTGIYYKNPADWKIIEHALEELSKRYDDPIEVENEPLRNFYPAENYHQDYLDKNPSGYCHIPKSLFERAKNANPEK